MKHCSCCKLPKPTGDDGEFHRNRSNPDGWSNQCKECMRALGADWYRRNRERKIAQSARWQQAHREADRAHSRRRHALLKATPGRHSRAEWEACKAAHGYHCSHCGNGDGHLTRDHIIPLGAPGCTNNIDNVQPLCPGCNSAKWRHMS